MVNSIIQPKASPSASTATGLIKSGARVRSQSHRLPPPRQGEYLILRRGDLKFCIRSIDVAGTGKMTQLSKLPANQQILNASSDRNCPQIKMVDPPQTKNTMITHSKIPSITIDQANQLKLLYVALGREKPVYLVADEIVNPRARGHDVCDESITARPSDGKMQNMSMPFTLWVKFTDQTLPLVDVDTAAILAFNPTNTLFVDLAKPKSNGIKKSLKAHAPALTATILFLGIVGICLATSLKNNDRHLIYALDDAYIHMAMAKNFSQHQQWGVTNQEFSSSSSSMLWTLLLSAVYLVFGVSETAPFIINLIAATILLWTVSHILRRHNLSTFWRFSLLITLVFITPLPTLVFVGMEHIIHIWLCVIFIYLAPKMFSRDQTHPPWLPILLIGIATLMVMTRLEGLFLVFVTCTLLTVRKKLPFALTLGAFSLLPVIVYGSISLSLGWSFLATPVIIKGNMPDLASWHGIFKFLSYGLFSIGQTSEILVLLLTALLVLLLGYRRGLQIWNKSSVILMMFIGATLLHMQFARTGWFWRYEAYLIVMGLLVIALTLPSYGMLQRKVGIRGPSLFQSLIFGVIILALCSPYIKRAARSLKSTVTATTNIYQQQYQMGRFLNTFYRNQGVAINDLGAVNYLADINTLDLWGVANSQVAQAITQGQHNLQLAYRLTKTHNIKIAVLYDPILINEVNQTGLYRWPEVGQWRIPNNIVCGSDIVHFFAVDPEQTESLISNLQQFSPNLPPQVIQTGLYTDTLPSVQIPTQTPTHNQK